MCEVSESQKRKTSGEVVMVGGSVDGTVLCWSAASAASVVSVASVVLER